MRSYRYKKRISRKNKRRTAKKYAGSIKNEVKTVEFIEKYKPDYKYVRGTRNLCTCVYAALYQAEDPTYKEYLKNFIPHFGSFFQNYRHFTGSTVKYSDGGMLSGSSYEKEFKKKFENLPNKDRSKILKALNEVFVEATKEKHTTTNDTFLIETDVIKYKMTNITTNTETGYSKEETHESEMPSRRINLGSLVSLDKMIKELTAIDKLKSHEEDAKNFESAKEKLRKQLNDDTLSVIENYVIKKKSPPR